jgi:predicted ATPase
MEMTKYFDIIPAKELRKLQKKAADKRHENYLIRAETAYQVFIGYDDISRVMSVFNVKRSEAYDLIKKGKAIKDESPERNKL